MDSLLLMIFLQNISCRGIKELTLQYTTQGRTGDLNRRQKKTERNTLKVLPFSVWVW